MHAVLDRHGLVSAAPRAARARPAPRSRGRPQPNALWCADYKGEFMLANRRYCYPLTITDFASRYLLTCEALSTTQEIYAFTVFERTFKEFGLPQAIRTDNGVPFAVAHALYGLSKLAVWWLRLGIQIERIRPGHPEQNGRHERMHLTLKTEATKPAAPNVLQQQARFDAFIDRYNHERPHQALGMKVPGRALRAVPAPLSRPRGARLSVSRLDHHRHPLRSHLLQAPEDQSEPGLCRAERRRQAGRASTSGSSPSWTTIWATSTTRRADSNRSRIRSAESVTHVSGINCYPCVRNGPQEWLPDQSSNLGPAD